MVDSVAMTTKSGIWGSGYPGSGTGGMRTMPSKIWVDDDGMHRTKDMNYDLENDEVDTDVYDISIKPILREPDDWVNPKVSKHRGPGA